jgi:hypothetical protein
MHNNDMAVLAKLKVEAKYRGVTIADSDARLMIQRCKLYLESLKMIEENSKPSHVIGEAIMSRCIGFRSSQKVLRDGKACLDWQVKDFEDCKSKSPRELWSRLTLRGLPSGSPRFDCVLHVQSQMSLLKRMGVKNCGSCLPQAFKSGNGTNY